MNDQNPVYADAPPSPRAPSTSVAAARDAVIGWSGSGAMADLIAIAPVGICTFDSAGGVRSWNPACEAILGWTSDEILDQPLPLKLNDIYRDFGGVLALVQCGESFSELEMIQQQKDGSSVEISLSAVPVRDSAGNVCGGMAIFTDIAERKRADAEHQKFASLVENSIDVITVMTLDGRPVYLNTAGRNMVGLDEVASMLGLEMPDLYPPQSLQCFTEQVIPTVLSQGRWDGDLRLRHVVSGGEIDVRGSVFVIEDHRDGRPLYLAASFRDIREKKHHLEAMRRRDTLLAAVATASNRLLVGKALAAAVEEAIAIVGQATHVQRAFVMTMFAADEGNDAISCFQWTTGESRSAEPIKHRLPKRWQAAFEQGQTIRGMVLEFPIEEQSLLTERGAVSVLMVPILIDRELWGIICFDDNNILRNWDEAEIAILSTLAGSLGAAVARFQSEGELVVSNEDLASSLQQQAAMTTELAKAKEGAELASHAKSEFLANMSHEIRTPMTAILGYADLLAEESFTPAERATHIQAIRRNGRHLLDLINDILDISKIEAGKMQVECIPFALCDVVSEVASMIRGRAEDKHLAFNVCYAGPVPELVQTDPTRLRQVLINLLGNAIKFTEAGSVRLLVEVRTEGSELRLRFTVRDTGVGMTTQQTNRLFQAFSQADNSTTRRFGGTGLGLHICKRLAAMLKGDLTVTSTHGQGSQFVFDIAGGPMAPDAKMIADPASHYASDAPAPAEITTRLAGRILLVEDGPDNQKLIAMYLRKAGATVDIVDNGRSACETALAAENSGTPYDLMLMDVSMPEMDGYTAASLLRNAGYPRPIIALTAHAMPEDRRKCLNCGYTDYTTKPIDRKGLIDMLAGYLSSKPAAAPAAPAAAAPQGDRAMHSNYESDPDFQDLLAEYVESLPQSVDELRRELDRQDKATLSRLIHGIKGTGGNFGFSDLHRLARQAEIDIEAGPSLNQTAEAVRLLIDGIRSVHGYNPDKEAYAR